MKNLTLSTLFLLLFLLASAQAPAYYYNIADGKSGYQLRIALFNIIKNHNQQSYSSLWEHFRQTDAKNDGTVWDMYSDNPDGNSAYSYTFANQCGNYNSEGDCFNREHSVPKSWFDDQYPMYTDLFHLYPTDGYVNNKRSNFPFGEVENATWTSTNGSKLGLNSTNGYSGTVFEPIDAYKGDFARTLFYMATRYMDKDLSQTESSAFIGSDLKPWALEIMLQWHIDDPVSEKEIERNNAVYEIQGNRNPFIDFPDLVEKIFGSDTLAIFLLSSFEEYENQLYTKISPNPAEDFITIFIPEKFLNLKSFCQILNLSGQLIEQHSLNQQNTEISISHLPKGFYLIKIYNSIYSKIQKLIIQ